MRRRHSRVFVIGLALVGIFASLWLPARAFEHREHYDEFNDSSFGGSDGPGSRHVRLPRLVRR